jgi:hypothetical protein
MRYNFETLLYLPLVALAVAIHLAIVLIPGNSVRTPWSGGGDTDAYVLLAGTELVLAHGPCLACILR